MYNVRFSSAFWKGVEVKRGETTVLEPAILTIKNASKEGHLVVDAANGKTVDFLRRIRPSASLVPLVVNVRFDQAVWKGVKLESGKTTILNPGVFSISGKVPKRKHLPIRDAKGKIVAYLRTRKTSVPLPPGSYKLTLGDDQIPFTLQEGKFVKLEIEYD